MPDFLVNCKKCRSQILNTAEYSTLNCHHEKLNELQKRTEETEAPSSSYCETLNDNSTLYLHDEPFPLFISNAIENSGWQKGKLSCPKCNIRIGSFNFVNGVHCSCSHSILPAINLHSSKIDYVIPSISKVVNDRLYNLNEDHESPASSHENEQKFVISSPGSSNDSPRSILTSAATEENSENNQMTIQVSDVLSDDSSGCFQLLYDPITVANSRHYLLEEQTSENIYFDNNSSSLRKRGKIPRSSLPQLSQCTEVPNPDPSEVENIIDEGCEIPDYLICPVCLDLLFIPFEVKPCKHIFCESCLRRLAKPTPNDTRCPLCRELIGICHPCPELSKEIKSKYLKKHKERHKFEKSHNCQHLPLPWLREYRFFGFRYGRATQRHNYGRNWTGWRTLALIFALDCLGMTLVLLLKWIFEDFEVNLGEVDGRKRALDAPQSSVELQSSYAIRNYMDARDIINSLNESVYSSLVE